MGEKLLKDHSSKIGIKFIHFLGIMLGGIITTGNAANILFYQGFGSYSHKLAVWPLVEALTDKGHNVTFVSSHQRGVSNPKIIELHPMGTDELIKSVSNGTLELRIEGTYQNGWEIYFDLGYEICKLTLADPKIRDLVKNSKFDLVIINSFCSECGLGLAYRFNSKFIIFGASSLFMWTLDSIGIVPETSWIPDMQKHFLQPMTFLQRLWNTMRPMYWHFYKRRWNYFPKLEELLRKELDIPLMPSLDEIERNTSLFFFNTHYSFEYGRSLPPAFVPVGGIHIKPTTNSLPKNIDDFIAGSDKNGVIFVSFGSLAKASKMPENIRSVFIDVFKMFKTTRFIWIWDTDRPEEMSENIMTLKWAPQQEILAHKKIKAFISHGGCSSLHESTYYGVPLIIFPLFGDQDYNANLIHQSGYGIKLEISRLSIEMLTGALSQILTDERYKKRALEVSNLFKDRPNTPLETAVWWTEYVIRHNNTKSLKPLSINQNWYERRLLDVWLFLFLTVCFTIYILFYILQKCLLRKRLTVTDATSKKIKKN